MNVYRFAPAVVWLVALAAIASPGCGGGGDTENNATTRSSTGGPGSSSASGTGGAGGEGGSGGGGGTGGASADNGHPGSETVSAGEVAKSSKYKMVFTLGQPTQNQEKTTSKSYRMQGGLIGANGSLP